MRKSEKILLVVTIGLGAVLSAVYLPTRGRTQSAPGNPGDPSTPQPPVAATEAGPATIEMLAAGDVELTPVPEGMRDPFRPLPQAQASTRVAVALRVTAIFGQQDNADRPLSALLRGERLGPGAQADGPVVHVEADVARVDAYLSGERVRLSSGEAELAALLRGRLVRAGDTLGAITVEEVTPRGVKLRCDDKLIAVGFQERSGD